MSAPNFPQPMPPGQGMPLPPWMQVKPPVLPVEDREYHHFLRTPRYAFWRPIVALLAALVAFFVLQMLMIIPLMVDVANGRVTQDELMSGKFPMTWPLMLASNIGLALLIPAALLIQKVCFGQDATWLHSVTGRLRWGWLGKCLAVVTPIWAIWLLAGSFIGGELDYKGVPDWAIYLLIVVFTTPLQAAGEEYFFRGLINRSVASWVPNRWGGLILGGLVSSGLFMVAHGAGDPWLNVYYFGLGVLFCVLTWLTGGLEAAIVVHVVNNVLAFLIGIWAGTVDDPIDRTAGVGDPTLLFSLLAGAIVAVLLWRWAKKINLVKQSAPGQALIANAPTNPPWPTGHFMPDQPGQAPQVDQRNYPSAPPPVPNAPYGDYQGPTLPGQQHFAPGEHSPFERPSAPGQPGVPGDVPDN